MFAHSIYHDLANAVLITEWMNRKNKDKHQYHLMLWGYEHKRLFLTKLSHKTHRNTSCQFLIVFLALVPQGWHYPLLYKTETAPIQIHLFSHLYAKANRESPFQNQLKNAATGQLCQNEIEMRNKFVRSRGGFYCSIRAIQKFSEHAWTRHPPWLRENRSHMKCLYTCAHQRKLFTSSMGLCQPLTA